MEWQGSRNLRRFVQFLAVSMVLAGMHSFTSAANTLPKEEAAAGWVRLFDGQTLFGWNQIGDAAWNVAGGSLVCESGSGGWLVTSNQFADFELQARMRINAGTTAGLVVRGKLTGHPTENGSGVVTLSEPKESDSPWREIRVRAVGQQVTAVVDGKTVVDLNARRSYGYIGIQYHHHRNVPGRIEVSEVRLRPLGLESIFNGMDLTGWNIVPGHPANFLVQDGALNVRDGRGQIETADTYKDFILQMDIISHGEHLNSGVFFRGPVGVFWRGYESQVRNQWEGDDRTRPVDFGTGGIYGMQPARAVVPDDHEWFHKTIICVGNQMTVWINGYMVADFTDNRPLHPQADGKFGYVPGPGTIHLQGHDPGTNLSFKNIRIHDLSP